MVKRHSSDATEQSGLAGPQTVHILPQFLRSWFLFSSIGSQPKQNWSTEGLWLQCSAPKSLLNSFLLLLKRQVLVSSSIPLLPLQAAPKAAFTVQGCHLVSIMCTAASGQTLTGSCSTCADLIQSFLGPTGAASFVC